MVQRIAVILFIILAIVASIIGVMSYLDHKISYAKLTSRDEIPAEIWQNIEKTEFKRGLYFFNHKFTDSEEMYFVVCGGEKHVNGYDVAIEDVTYQPWDSSGSNENRRIYRGGFEVVIKELVADARTTYSEDFEYPFVVFKLKGKYSEQDYLAVISDNQKLGVNYWWGAKTFTGKNESVTYEVLQSKDDISADIWYEIERMTLREGIYEFIHKQYKTDSLYYLVCGGDRYPNNYNATIEHVWVEAAPPGYADYECRVILREDGTKGTPPYAEGFDYPFVVCKIKSLKNDDTYLTLDGPRSIDTVDEHGDWHILFDERSMSAK